MGELVYASKKYQRLRRRNQAFSRREAYAGSGDAIQLPNFNAVIYGTKGELWSQWGGKASLRPLSDRLLRFDRSRSSCFGLSCDLANFDARHSRLSSDEHKK